MELLKAGSWSEAQARFEFALATRETPGLVYYVALCLENQNQFVEARKQYRHAEQLLKEVPAGDVAALLPDAIARVEGALATISLEALPETVRVVVDGKLIQDRGALRLNPGAHRFKLTSPQYEDYEWEVVLARGEERTLHPELVERKNSEPVARVPSPPLGESDTKAQSDTSDAGPSSFVKPLVIGTAALVSVAGLATGIYFTVATANASQRVRDLQNEIDQEGEGTNFSCSSPAFSLADSCLELREELREKRRSRVWTAVGYSVFGAGALVTVAAQAFFPTTPVEVAILPGGGQLGWSQRF